MPISLDEFLGFYTNKRTATGYQTALIHFLSLIYNYQKASRYVTPEELKTYNQLSIRYITDERDHAADLMQFAVSLSDRPPKTANLYVAAVKQYFLENDIEISQRMAKRIRGKMPKGGAQTIEKEISRQLIKEVVQHMDIKTRAYSLLLASSGMRPGEALKLELDDLDLTTDPGEIHIPGTITKTGEPRLSFMSPEAAEALRSWLQVREQYLAASINRDAGLRRGRAPKTMDDRRLFPFSYNVLHVAWTNALSKSGHYSLCKTTGRKQVHPHMLRKFFLSQFTGDNTKIGEHLAGHSGYLTDSYRRIPRAELIKEYRKVLPRLTILAPDDYALLDERDRAALQRQAEIIASQSDEIRRMNAEMDSIKSDMEDWKSLLHNLKAEAEADPLYETAKAHIEKAKRQALEELGLSG